MLVYDTDVEIESELLSERIGADNLLDRKLLQSFGPDTLSEARNRGFRTLLP